MKFKKTTCLIISSIIISLIVGIVIGNFVCEKSLNKKLFLIPYNKVNAVLDIIDKEYVDTVHMKDITEKAILHIVNELDPHSVYIPRKDLQQFNDNIEGYCGGIGLNYLLYRDTVVVVNVTPRGPASEAGLLPGDRIIYINDSIFMGNNITGEKVMQTLRGQVGTSIKLDIQRNFSDSIIKFDIKRKNILLTTVKAAYEIEKGIGFIKICDRFTHSTYNEFMQAVTKLLVFGCSSFIIDLRMNGGGSYDTAIKIINEFLPASRMIVYAEGKSFSHKESIADGRGILQKNQVVILIDEMSASASEIIAGSIQDNDRGLIIGRHSFGKGLIQNQIKLSDGSAIRLTIARYYIPSGRNIQREYKLGKSVEYNKEWIDQFNSFESLCAGSIKKIDLSLAYHTLYGRIVYGGDGIVPDIFVPANTSRLSSYYLNLEEKNIFNWFAFEYSDRNRSVLGQFKDYSSMLEYLKTQPILEEIIDFASKNGVKKRTFLIDYSADQILNTAYAWILNIFFGEEVFYRIYLNNDSMLMQAVKAIKKGYAHPKSIVAMEYKD